MNLLKFYKDCMRTGRLPKNGLCNSITKIQLARLDKFLRPTKLPRNDNHAAYWGNGNLREKSIFKIQYSFTPLRQTLVLLLNEIMKDLKKEKQ